MIVVMDVLIFNESFRSNSSNSKISKRDRERERERERPERPERLLARLRTVSLEEPGPRVLVLRPPRGPDGSRGFRPRRPLADQLADWEQETRTTRHPATDTSRTTTRRRVYRFGKQPPPPPPPGRPWHRDTVTRHRHGLDITFV